MYTQRNVENLQIGGTATKTTANYANALNNSEVGIFTAQGVRMTEALAATETHFMVASKDASGNIYTSPIYAKADIQSHSVLVYAAATQQVDYVGYNGSTGSITAVNDNLYKINLFPQELLRSNTDGRAVKFGLYQSDSSATQAEIAIGLAGSLIDNFDREAEKWLEPKAISNVALASDFVFDATFEITGTNGSNTLLSAAATPTYNTGTALAVGDFLRIGTAAGATGAAVALLSDVYEVIELPTTTTIKLDRKLQTDSGSYLIADGSITVIPAATGIAGNWGIGMTGAALDYVTGKENYGVIRWETNLVDFSTTTTNLKSTEAYEGSGVINQIKQMEWFMQGNEGEYYREGFSTIHPSRVVTDDSVTGGGYDMIRLTFDISHNVSFSTNNSPAVLSFATPATTPNYALNATADDITDCLEVLATGTADGSLSLG